MEEWTRRLYQHYVSTGQAGDPLNSGTLNSPYCDRLIAEHMPKDRNLAILDLACGHGRLIHSLKKHGYTRVLGIDVSEEQVAVAHKLGISEVRCEDVHEFLRKAGSQAFDVVFLMDILEHLNKQDLFTVLDGVSRILTDQGMLVAHVPNGAGIFGMNVRYGDFTHQNAFTSQSIQQVLRACRFTGVTAFEDKPVVHGVVSLVRYMLWQALTLPFRLLLAAESGTMHHLLSQNMLVIARKSTKGG